MQVNVGVLLAQTAFHLGRRHGPEPTTPAAGLTVNGPPGQHMGVGVGRAATGRGGRLRARSPTSGRTAAPGLPRCPGRRRQSGWVPGPVPGRAARDRPAPHHRPTSGCPAPYTAPHIHGPATGPGRVPSGGRGLPGPRGSGPGVAPRPRPRRSPGWAASSVVQRQPEACGRLGRHVRVETNRLMARRAGQQRRHRIRAGCRGGVGGCTGAIRRGRRCGFHRGEELGLPECGDQAPYEPRREHRVRCRGEPDLAGLDVCQNRSAISWPQESSM